MAKIYLLTQAEKDYNNSIPLGVTEVSYYKTLNDAMSAKREKMHEIADTIDWETSQLTAHLDDDDKECSLQIIEMNIE